MDQGFFQAWLDLQCQVIPEVRSAFVRTAGEEAVLAAWPAGSRIPEPMRELLDLSLRSGTSVTSHTGLRRAVGSDVQAGPDGPGLLLAQPLRLAGSDRAAVVLELPARLQSQQKAVTNLLDWGNAWLDFARAQSARRDAAEDDSLRLVRCVAGQRRFQAAALAALGWLAHRFDCRRVSLGVRDRRGFRLVASSDKAFVAGRTDLTGRLEQAMQDAADASAGDDSDAEPNQQVDDSGRLHTGLLRFDARDFAAVCLEPRSDAPLSAAQSRQIGALLPLLGELLGLRRHNERPWPERTRQALSPGAGWVRPLSWSIALIAVAFVLMNDTVYRVGGPAVVEGEVQQALIAPFAGYVERAPVRAGQQVAAGQVLAELDDRELRLQHRLRQGDKAEFDKEYRQALAGMDHAQARILAAQIEQAEAEIELLDRQLARTRLLAPFDGIVVSGDLSRSLGKPVERGEVLFEVAPLDSYRVAVEVRDRDIREIEPGRRGALALAAVPSRRLPLEVVNVTRFIADATQSEGFRVEAHLLETPAVLRPGMRGVAKIDLGRRPRIWVWTHELIDWLRLQLWTWLP